MTVNARVVIKGEVPPVPVVFTTEALSLWGGFDPDTGTVTDAHHPLCGTRLAGSIFVLPAGRGSSTSSAILLEAVRRVSRGESLLDPAVSAKVLARLRDPAPEDDLLAKLSPQEHKILDLIAEGLTNREIAKEMFLAEKTVKNYVSNLLAKLGMSHRSEAAAYAARLDERKRLRDHN
jgi:DNA-binding CsgD family transcriptional regulator